MTELQLPFGKVTVQPYTPPVENADVIPLVTALIDADGADLGKNEAVTVYASKSEAEKYRTKIQRATRAKGLTAWSTVTETDDGAFALATRLRPAIDRAPKEDIKEPAPKVDKK